jgi:GxxExxY protein
LDRQDRQVRQGLPEPSAELDAIGRAVVDAAIKVHRALGPGLLESAYEHCLAHELHQRGLSVRRQVQLPIESEGLRLEAGYRLDVLVQERVVVEVKAVEALSRLHEAQVLTYLKLAKLRLGYLLNFNTLLMRDGVRRLLG